MRERGVVERADVLPDAGTGLPISRTSDAATAYPISSAAVIPKHACGSRTMSSSDPVNVIAGWIASGMQPISVNGASTAMPLAPDVWTTMVPGLTALVAASPDASPASSASGTASSRSSARAATSGTGSTAVSGSRRSARSRDACEMALQATTAVFCSFGVDAERGARPTEMTPMLNRAGRSPLGSPSRRPR